MKPRIIPASLLALGLLLAACGGDPLKGVNAALKGGDLAKAETELKALVAEKPDLAPAHAALFVLYRHQVLQGAPAMQEAYLTRSIQEFDWLAKRYGVTPDYKDMEASLKTKPETAALLAAARKPLYGE